MSTNQSINSILDLIIKWTYFVYWGNKNIFIIQKILELLKYLVDKISNDSFVLPFYLYQIILVIMNESFCNNFITLRDHEYIE